MTTMTTDEGLLSRVTLKFRQRMCGLHGHDSLLHFDNGRISLLCSSCGHESPGWALTETPPTITEQGDARRHMLVRPEFAEMRRIA